jgi:hypothetical protein
MHQLAPDALQLELHRDLPGIQVHVLPCEAQHFTSAEPEDQDQPVRRVQRVADRASVRQELPRLLDGPGLTRCLKRRSPQSASRRPPGPPASRTLRNSASGTRTPTSPGRQSTTNGSSRSTRAESTTMPRWRLSSAVNPARSDHGCRSSVWSTSKVEHGRVPVCGRASLWWCGFGRVVRALPPAVRFVPTGVRGIGPQLPCVCGRRTATRAPAVPAAKCRMRLEGWRRGRGLRHAAWAAVRYQVVWGGKRLAKPGPGERCSAVHSGSLWNQWSTATMSRSWLVLPWASRCARAAA